MSSITESDAPENGIIRKIIYITLIIGANVGYSFLLHRVLENNLLKTILIYFGFFISFMWIYFIFFGFDFGILFRFILAFIISVFIALFLMIFMSPTYCQDKQESNIGIYTETLLFGLLVYLMYFYLTYYVLPFFNNMMLPNNINHDFIFFGIIATLFSLVMIINYFVKSKIFQNINFYALLVYLFILSMKIYVVVNQSFYPSQIQSGGGYYDQPRTRNGFFQNILIREPDYLHPRKHRKKSFFYNLT